MVQIWTHLSSCLVAKDNPETYGRYDTITNFAGEHDGSAAWKFGIFATRKPPSVLISSRYFPLFAQITTLQDIMVTVGPSGSCRLKLFV
jgi:hypothetical protein